MALIPITVRKPWEIVALLKEKGRMIHVHLDTCPSLEAMAVDQIAEEVARMGELVVGLREAIASMPKPAPAQERKRA